MSSRIEMPSDALPQEYLLETYKDHTVWIIWADGRRRMTLRQYAEMWDKRCRGKGNRSDGECGTFPGEPCNGVGNISCMGMPGDGSHGQFRSTHFPWEAENDD